MKPVLLYGAETWRTTVATMKRIPTFVNTSLRRILKIRWPDILINQDLWKRTTLEPTEVDIFQKRWNRLLPIVLAFFWHFFYILS